MNSLPSTGENLRSVLSRATDPQSGLTTGFNNPITMNDSFHLVNMTVACLQKSPETCGRLPLSGNGDGVHFLTLKAFLNNIQQIAAKDMASDCKCQSCNDRRAIMKLAGDAMILLATPTH